MVSSTFVVVLVGVVARASAQTHAHQHHRGETSHGDGNFVTFPPSFAFGVGTSAWQIEGNGGDRPRSVWDAFVSELGEEKRVEAERGIGFHERYAADAQMMADAGVKHFKMSLSWPRLMRADGSAIDEGFEYYQNVFGALRERGVEPHVTLFHWDTPMWCCANETIASGRGSVCEGAWVKDEILKDFEKYADAVFSRLGKGIKYWTTISEPKTVAEMGYGAGLHAPGRRSVEEQLKVGHNMLRAHALAVALYREKYSQFGGKLSINLNSAWVEPASDSPDDVRAAANAMDEELGWFADPIYKGDYPASMRARLGSFLPEFTEEERVLVKGSVDYFALNHYTSYFAKHVTDAQASSQLGLSGRPQPWEITLESEKSKKPIGKEAQSDWLHIVPWGLEKVLLHIKDRYDDPAIMISENGVDIAERGDIAETLDDTTRVKFIDAYLGAAREAMRKGANVVGYFYWSMFDNVEWVDGRSKRFGLVYVDYDGKYGEKMKRYPKKSLEHFSSYMRGEHAEEPTLGAARVRHSLEDSFVQVDLKRQGEIFALQGMALTIACVYAAAAAFAGGVKIVEQDVEQDERSSLV
jgi:beta-glucosidase/6-phospho-beta-glucosidase/beta-galactosidase